MLRLKKRLAALLACAAVIMPQGGVSAAAPNITESDNTAEVFLGGTIVSSGIKEVGVGQTNKPLAVEKGDESCWEIPSKKWENCYIYVKLSDKIKAAEYDGSAYSIEVDYFDTGNGFFKIVYRDRQGEVQTAALIYTKGTLEWKTAKITVYDAQFNEDGYDPKIVIPNQTTSERHRYGDFAVQTRTQSSNPWSAVAIDIKRIKVTRESEEYPIYLKAHNDKAGGIYKWYEKEKLLYTDAENMTDKKQAFKLTSTLIGKHSGKSLSMTEDVELEAREKKTLSFDFGALDYCDIYELFLKVETADGNTYSRKHTEVAVLKTDPDGIKNENVYFSAHVERYTDDSAEQLFRVLSLSNSGGYRGEFQWQEIVDSNGAFKDIDTTTYGRTVNLIRKYGLKYLPILNCPPTNDTFKAWNDMPKTEKQFEQWRRYVGVAADYLKDVTHRYELFNEPNIAAFNLDRNTFWGAEYAKLAQVTKDEIIKHDPEALIGGPSLTGIGVANMDANCRAPEFFEEGMKAGMGNGMDAITLHPYWYGAAKSFEESSRVDDILWYKNLYKEYTGRTTEIWHTESGISAYDVSGRTPENKGILNCRFILTAKAEGASDISSIYNMERKGELDTNREDLYGNVSPGYENVKVWDKMYFPTESFMMITALNYIMANSTAEGVLSVDDRPNIKIDRFKSEKFNSNIAAFWTTGAEENITFRLDCENLTVYDCYGNETQLSSDDGVYSFAVTEEPKYISGDFKDIEILYENKFELDKFKSDAAANDIFEIGVKTNTSNSKYALNAELPEGTTLANIDDFGDGESAAAGIRNNLSVGTKFKVTLNVTDDKGNKVWSADVPIESVKPIGIRLGLKLSDGADVNKWTATAKITNYSSSSSAKGHLEFNSPSIVSKIKNIDIGVIPRNTTGQISFELPKIIKKGEYRFAFDYVSETGERYSFEEETDLTVAPYAKTKPIIDGVLDKNEWVYDASVYADSASQVRQIVGWGGASDLSGKSTVMWDEDNMYMYAEVTDNVFLNDYPLSAHWNGDSIQVGIVYGDEEFIALGQSGTKFNEFGLALSSVDGAGAYRTMSQNDGWFEKGIIKDAEVKIVNSGNKTVYEARIPWTSLIGEGISPNEGDMLGFSFLINDNDGGGRRGWIEHAGGIGETKNTEMFTYLTLIK